MTLLDVLDLNQHVMSRLSSFEPTRAQALERARLVDPVAYAQSRNHLDGAVSGLSPYITHGLISLPEVVEVIRSKHPVRAQDKWMFELGWREYFRHVWQFTGSAIFHSLQPVPLAETFQAKEMPPDIRSACTGVPVIDQAVRTLYATGYLHNHARMWLASYVVHLRKVHWRVGADWLYGHLLDGDLASNHLSWQWVAGTGSSKPYLFNADNVARYAPNDWHSPGSVLDCSYEGLERLARQAQPVTGKPAPKFKATALDEPALLGTPPDTLGWSEPQSSEVSGRDVWLVHPWSLGEWPSHLSPQTVVVGIGVCEFHQTWPWSARRWHFVSQRMSELCQVKWWGDAEHMGAALRHARTVSSMDDPHIRPWLSQWARCEPTPTLFPSVDVRCNSFSKWWNRINRTSWV